MIQLHSRLRKTFIIIKLFITIFVIIFQWFNLTLNLLNVLILQNKCTNITKIK